jgi:hypothetical protein
MTIERLVEIFIAHSGCDARFELAEAFDSLADHIINIRCDTATDHEWKLAEKLRKLAKEINET